MENPELKIEKLDIERVRKIHEKHYEEEFEFPNFSKFTSSFQISNTNHRIITAGGIRFIPEIVLITDKDASVKERAAALTDALAFLLYYANKHNMTELHAFVQDALWKKRLFKIGFHPPVGECLVLNL